MRLQHYIHVLFLSISLSGLAHTVNIGILSDAGIREFSVIVASGQYSLINKKNNAEIISLTVGDSITFEFTSGLIRLTKNKEQIGAYDSVKYVSTDTLPVLRIRIHQPKLPDVKVYEDDLLIKARKWSLLLVNTINIEKYVAGVVEAEGGSNIPDTAYYQAHATICRTYAFRNINKHAKEGFNLCDKEHCQVYKGKCKDKNNIILPSALTTHDHVIVDSTNTIITATFYSNSGGQTCNAEDVWNHPVSYLRSIEDTFSLARSKAYWEKNITKQSWLTYLAMKHDFPMHDEQLVDSSMHFTQTSRNRYFLHNIPLTTIRTDLKLNSTFFSIEPKGGDTLLFKGRGFGHGVGLSQEGAMEMARLGYTYEDIILFYYKDVRIVNIDSLNPKRKPRERME